MKKENFKNNTIAELRKLLADERNKLHSLGFSLGAAGKDTMTRSKLRRTIARLCTEITHQTRQSDTNTVV